MKLVDAVLENARALNRQLGQSDRRKMDQYLTSLDEIESRLRAKGCLRCYLMVTTDNEEAMRYYEKRGWDHMDWVVPYGKNLN